MKFADVLLPFGDLEANHSLTYKVPPDLENEIFPGDPVVVPFRKAVASGYVVGESSNPGKATRSIAEKNRKLASLPHQTLDFSRWISNRFLSPWWEALRGFSHPGQDPTNGKKEFAFRKSSLRFSLTPEQNRAAIRIHEALEQGKHEIFLLHGITGSGKTEVYLSCASAALQLGKEVLILVPEIPLSFQVARRFREVFGDRVAVLHSALSEKERKTEQARFAAGEASIVVGPRMALFAPFRKLGLVVMDEEHDSSYKQESHPRYHARIVARKLALQQNAALVLGSATPSLESYHAAAQGEFSLLTLSSRYEARPLPRVQIVDMREPNLRQMLPFSLPLVESLRETADKGEQAILFLNRRGFSPLVLCRDCGHTFQCPRCSITLTFHLSKGILLCHYCDYQIQAPSICPKCDGMSLTYRGFGTQRLEEEIHKYLPGIKVLRLDRDSASRRGSTREIVEAFLNREAPILIGTQMVTKGFDFPNVSLVGILNADHHLHFPDFRSAEKTFQLITQVSGRAGRGAVEGKVILQTYDPEHPVIQAASRHDYPRFYEEEIQHRQAAFYPPFSHLANLVLASADEAELEKRGGELAAFLEAARTGMAILGPSPCPIGKINKNFRWHVMMKSAGIKPLLDLGKEAYLWFKKSGSRKVKLTVDVDPASLL